MLKLVDDLQNIIITYLDPKTYSILSILYQNFTINRYETPYIKNLIASINLINSKNIEITSDIIKSCVFNVLNLFRKLEIFFYLRHNYTLIKHLEYSKPDYNVSISIRVKISKNFHIYKLNNYDIPSLDDTIAVSKISIEYQYGLFYMNENDELLSFEYDYFGKAIDIQSTLHQVTLKTPLWNLLQETMKLIVKYYNVFLE